MSNNLQILETSIKQYISIISAARRAAEAEAEARSESEKRAAAAEARTQQQQAKPVSSSIFPRIVDPAWTQL